MQTLKCVHLKLSCRVDCRSLCSSSLPSPCALLSTIQHQSVTCLLLSLKINDLTHSLPIHASPINPMFVYLLLVYIQFDLVDVSIDTTDMQLYAIMLMSIIYSLPSPIPLFEMLFSIVSKCVVQFVFQEK
jgi:hypothetical protein